jgi:hypothetical protein
MFYDILAKAPISHWRDYRRIFHIISGWRIQIAERVEIIRKLQLLGCQTELSYRRPLDPRSRQHRITSLANGQSIRYHYVAVLVLEVSLVVVG